MASYHAQTSNTGHHLLMHSGSQHSLQSEGCRWPNIKDKVMNTRKWCEPMPRRSRMAPKWQLNFRSLAQCLSWAHSSLPKARPMRSFNVLPVTIYTNVHVDRQRKIEVNTQVVGVREVQNPQGWGRVFTHCSSASPSRRDDSQFDSRTLLVDSCALQHAMVGGVQTDGPFSGSCAEEDLTRETGPVLLWSM